MPPFYTESEFINMLRVSGVQASHDLIRRIRPVMASRDEAWQVGHGRTRPWVYSTFAPVTWAAYFQLRAHKIACGEWTQRRAYLASDIPLPHEPSSDV